MFTRYKYINYNLQGRKLLYNKIDEQMLNSCKFTIMEPVLPDKIKSFDYIINKFEFCLKYLQDFIFHKLNSSLRLVFVQTTSHDQI